MPPANKDARHAMGIHAVRHLLRNENADIVELCIEEGRNNPRIEELCQMAKRRAVAVRRLPPEAMLQLSGGHTSHQGVLARLRIAPPNAQKFASWLEELQTPRCHLLLLDQVTDPRNLGACLRTAEAAGCAAVVLPRHHSADPYTPVASKTACGASSRLPIFRVGNLNRAIDALRSHGFWIYGLAGDGAQCLFDTRFPSRTALILGAEDTGLRRLVRENCDQLLRIPMPGEVESLNVSVATGIALFELVRQRQQDGNH